MRTSKQIVDPEIQAEIFALLPQLLADIKSASEIKKFLHIFLSVKEFEVLAKRLAVMYWLKREKTYHEIKDELKVSSATIATAQDLIQKEELHEAFKILDANEWAQKWSERLKNIVGTSKAA